MQQNRAAYVNAVQHQQPDRRVSNNLTGSVIQIEKKGAVGVCSTSGENLASLTKNGLTTTHRQMQIGKPIQLHPNNKLGSYTKSQHNNNGSTVTSVAAAHQTIKDDFTNHNYAV